MKFRNTMQVIKTAMSHVSQKMLCSKEFKLMVSPNSKSPREILIEWKNYLKNFGKYWYSMPG